MLRGPRRRLAPERLGAQVGFLSLVAVGLLFFSDGLGSSATFGAPVVKRDNGAAATFYDGEEYHGTGRGLLSTNSTESPAPVAESPAPAESGGDYPEDLFTKEQRSNGAVILHVLCMCYMFGGLAIICDDYFVPSLEVICEQLQLKDDVAGATFMAAGGSAPELATSILGVFVSHSDVGFAAIVGSAVFNVLFVLAGCGLIAPGLPLTWWPLARDCSYYGCSIMLTICVVVDKQVQWWESLIMLGGYIGYVIVMKFNEDLEVYVKSQLFAAKEMAANRPTWRHILFVIIDSTVFHVLIYVTIILSVLTVWYGTDGSGDLNDWDIVNYVCCGIFILEMFLKWGALGFFGYVADGLNVFDMVLVALIIFEIAIQQRVEAFRIIRVLRFLRVLRLVRLLRLVLRPKADACTQWVEDDWEQDYIKVVPVKVNRRNSIAWRRSSKMESPGELQSVIEHGASGNHLAVGTAEGKELPPADTDEDEDEEDDDPPNPFHPPEGMKSRIFWAIMFPLSVLLFVTVPHCKRERFRKWYPLTFALCVVWIAVLSYIMVWMATVMGQTLGIPDPVMGVTILAAGTSVPDLLESLAVARRGQGDMAVSSSIGSNVFDLLMGLPLPWFIASAIVRQEPTAISSDGLPILVLNLFLMVGFTIAMIVFENWQLTRRMSVVFALLYVIFATESVLLEYGYINLGVI